MKKIISDIESSFEIFSHQFTEITKNDFVIPEDDYQVKSVQDQSKIIVDRIFSQRGGLIINEKWENSYTLSGRIISTNEQFVICETILDNETKKTQVRTYPFKLFEHLPIIEKGRTVKIKINEKAGSFRYDIIDGSNMGIEKEFDEIDVWSQLEGYEMDNPE